MIEAVGYPDGAPDGALSFTFRVDGAEVFAEEAAGRLVLSCVLTDDETLLPQLARYAAGRMLREEATFSFGPPGLSPPDRRPAAFLWQDAPAGSDGPALLGLFETFMNSCDWWRERVEGRRSSAESLSADSETMVIRP